MANQSFTWGDDEDDNMLLNAADHAEWENTFDNALEAVNELGELSDISAAGYYEELGRILEALDPGSNINPCMITENSMDINDIVYARYDDNQYASGSGAEAVFIDQSTSDNSNHIGQYGGGIIHQDKLFAVLRKSERIYKKFNTQGVYYSLDIPKPDPKQNPVIWLERLLDGIIEYFVSNSTLNIRPGDRVGMTLSNTLLNAEPLYISLRRADQMSASVVLDTLMNVFASNKAFFLNGHLTVQFDHVHLPIGAGRVKRQIGETGTDFIWHKACFLKYKVDNADDQFCLPYALVLSRAHLRCKLGEISNNEFRRYREGVKLIKREAVSLCLEAGVDMSTLPGCTFDEVRKFQNILHEYQIVIYTGFEMKSRPYTDSRYQSNTRKLNIMLHNNHYYAMRSITACFAVDYICPDCHVVAQTAVSHSCKYACSFCEATPKCKPNADCTMITCDECNRDFPGDDCYNNHLAPKGNGKTSVCAFRKKCPICKVTYKRTYGTKDEHYCGIHYCRICENHEANTHQCHMPLYETRRKENENYLYVFYDFETQQDTPMSESEPNKFRHIPNLCVLQSACSTCYDSDEIETLCRDCGVRESIFNSVDCVENLLDYLVKKCSEKVVKTIEGKKKKVYKFRKIIAIAHNMSGFDGQFILKYIYESDRFSNPNLIINGTKAVKIGLGGRIDFIDSLNYFHAGLAKLPKLFGFEGSKGYYCHMFNTIANEDYIGSLPARHFYCPETMTVEGRQAFNKWYESHPTDYIFDNRRELIEYCRQDVVILRKACLKFDADFWNCNHISPFIDGCSIAGVCNKVFRSKFLVKDTIGIIPTGGYRFADNQSEIAIKWLCLVEQDMGIEIQHAGRGPEAVIVGVGRVDGLFMSTVFEFDGCWYHGCTTCFPMQCTSEDTSDRAAEMRLRRQKTRYRHKAIKEAGYSLVVMKECDFRRKLRSDPDLDLQLQNHPMLRISPLNPRDAFFGGRTNANTLYFKSDGVTKMHYVDICSLYPYINKTSKNILSHPKIHVGADCSKVVWQNLDGLMKVTILPPRGLDFPVLPMRMHSKLMFALCRTCAEDLNQYYCDHKQELREISGTWVIDEVKLAVSKGYEIVSIHEIWEYKVSQYDPKTGTGGLFSGYINAFLKIKAEASGWPKSCKTPEQKQAYIDEFFEREGVLLNENKIEFNPGLRQLAKTQLNSFWGRFGMRPDLTRTVLIKCYDELVRKMFDHNIEIHSIIPVNDDNMLLMYKELEAGRIPDKTTNVVIAAFTTAYARMELYKYLDLLGTDRVFYFDTDSILYSQAPGEVMPERGNFLGQMTDELEAYGQDSFITEFVSGGPKNYAYKVFSPTTDKTHTIVKVKGITLNYENSQVINFDVIKNMVIGPENNSNEIQIDSVNLENSSIRRTNLGDVYTTRVPKTYRFNYTKRQKTDIDYKTLPYGY